MITLQLPQLLFVQSLVSLFKFKAIRAQLRHSPLLILLSTIPCSSFSFCVFFKGYEVGWVWFAFFGREIKVAVGVGGSYVFSALFHFLVEGD